jgi:hypothetical protein
MAAVIRTTILLGLCWAAPALAAPEFGPGEFFGRQPGKVGTCSSLSEDQVKTYAQIMAGAHEPSLARRSQVPDPAYKETYRFTLLPSLSTGVIVRVEKLRTNNYRLIVDRLSDRGGYQSGRVANREERFLTSDEIKRLMPVLDSLRETPETNCAPGIDGEDWIFEVHAGRSYSIRRAWSPTSGPVKKAGDAMLTLAPRR